MKRIILITLLIAGLTAAYSFAQMGQGMMGSQSQQQPAENPYGGGYYPCPQMMGPGMMGGYGMGPDMMGPGMMGGYGMGPGMMGGYGMGPGMMGRGMMGYGYRSYGSNPQEYQKYQEEYQKYLNQTVDLRKKLHDKRFEYFEAMRNPDTKRDTLMRLEKEIRDLQWDIYEKAPR
jgi:hypothetical protein